MRRGATRAGLDLAGHADHYVCGPRRSAAVKATARRISALIYRGLKFGAAHMDTGAVA